MWCVLKADSSGRSRAWTPRSYGHRPARTTSVRDDARGIRTESEPLSSGRGTFLVRALRVPGLSRCALDLSDPCGQRDGRIERSRQSPGGGYNSVGQGLAWTITPMIMQGVSDLLDHAWLTPCTTAVSPCLSRTSSVSVTK